MTRTTRSTVEAMLPPGRTLTDLTERELAELFKAVVSQTPPGTDEAMATPGMPHPP